MEGDPVVGLDQLGRAVTLNGSLDEVSQLLNQVIGLNVGFVHGQKQERPHCGVGP